MFGKIYIFTIFLRFFIVFLPITSYIHPDEYFQSVEILAGKILNLQTKTPWEFNTTSPIRSMTLQYFTIGMSFKVLQTINFLLYNFRNITIMTPYFILLFPRLLICISSFIVDYSLYKICILNNEKFKSKIVILSTSYVIVIYCTKTFTNSIELILYSYFLYLICDSMISMNEIVKKKEYVNYRYKNTKSLTERCKLHKLNLMLHTNHLQHLPKLGFIFIVGLFNRPTFVIFCIIPLFFYIYRGLGSKIVNNLQFHLRIILFVIYCIPPIVFIVIGDSFFYNLLTWGEIGMLDIGFKNFVFVPLNFVKYNLNTNNLKTHGLHPKYLHSLVNLPLLFSFLTFYYYRMLGEFFYTFTEMKLNQLPSIRSIKGLMTLTTLVSTLLFSLIPHQEPRFLIPLILPLVYLNAEKILPDNEGVLINTRPKADIKSNGEFTNKGGLSKIKRIFTGLKKRENKTNQIGINKTFTAWIILNLILGIFYGFLHQSGVIYFGQKFFYSKNTLFYQKNTSMEIFSSHVYMLPEFLIVEHKPRLKYAEDGLTPLIPFKRFNFHDEGSENLRIVTQKIGLTINEQKKVFLILPEGLKWEAVQHLKEFKLGIKEIDVFYPTISVEALDLNAVYLEVWRGLNGGGFEGLREVFGLGLYQIVYDVY